MVPLLTVFDALSMKVKPVSRIAAVSVDLAAEHAEFRREPICGHSSLCLRPSATYAPGTTRFRMFTTASADSSHVYVSVCDAGTIADVVTATNTVSTGTMPPTRWSPTWPRRSEPARDPSRGGEHHFVLNASNGV